MHQRTFLNDGNFVFDSLQWIKIYEVACSLKLISYYYWIVYRKSLFCHYSNMRFFLKTRLFQAAYSYKYHCFYCSSLNFQDSSFVKLNLILNLTSYCFLSNLFSNNCLLFNVVLVYLIFFCYQHFVPYDSLSYQCLKLNLFG